MAKSKESFGKKEKEKKRQKERQEKMEKKEERKANARKGQSLDDMMAYIDEDGNLSSTPPDPSKKKVFNQEDIQIGVPRYEETEEDLTRTGIVAFFDRNKGFGFINDLQTKERVFVHINQLESPVDEGNKVSFEIGSGPKGPVAMNVKKVL